MPRGGSSGGGGRGGGGGGGGRGGGGGGGRPSGGGGGRPSGGGGRPSWGGGRPSGGRPHSPGRGGVWTRPPVGHGGRTWPRPYWNRTNLSYFPSDFYSYSWNNFGPGWGWGWAGPWGLNNVSGCYLPDGSCFNTWPANCASLGGISDTLNLCSFTGRPAFW
jgi:hypothetical protein